MLCQVTECVCCQIFVGINVTLLAKLDAVLENQKEQLTLLRKIAAVSQLANDTAVLVDDILLQRLNTIVELQELNTLLAGNEFRKKLVYLL